jgi:hypothetical protein
MLVQNKSFHSQNGVNTKGQNSANLSKSGRRKQKPLEVSSRSRQQLFKCNTTKNEPIPLWLTILLLTKNASSLVCYVTVGLALAIYGMTVYAPQLWTQKYNQLRDLQKQERQFTFGDEVMKNQLANFASRSDSGLVNPDPTKPPIFLPETKVKQISQSSSAQQSPKQIHPIYPIAY